MSSWLPLLSIQLFWLHGDEGTTSYIISLPLELIEYQTASTLTWKVPDIAERLDRQEQDLQHLKRDLSGEQTFQELLTRTEATLFNLRRLRNLTAIVERGIRRVVDVRRLSRRESLASSGEHPFVIEVKDHRDLGAVVSLWPHLCNLEGIQFSGLDFTDSYLTAPIVAQTLPLLAGLRKVHIADCLHLSLPSLGKLVTGLRSLRRLQVFEMTGVALSANHLQILAAVIQIPSLTTFSLREDSIDDPGAQALATALRGMTGLCALETLKLSDNLLGREGITALISAFQDQRTAGIFPSFNALDLTQDKPLSFAEMVGLYGL
jgi:hypothetical protein